MEDFRYTWKNGEKVKDYLYNSDKRISAMLKEINADWDSIREKTENRVKLGGTMANSGITRYLNIIAQHSCPNNDDATITKRIIGCAKSGNYRKWFYMDSKGTYSFNNNKKEWKLIQIKDVIEEMVCFPCNPSHKRFNVMEQAAYLVKARNHFNRYFAKCDTWNGANYFGELPEMDKIWEARGMTDYVKTVYARRYRDAAYGKQYITYIYNEKTKSYQHLETLLKELGF